VPPSPNIPTFESALLYIGTCLFEGVNLNEGRGTETPFQVFGAPWMDGKKVVSRMEPGDHPGCRLEVVEYTPRSIPGKSKSPTYQDQVCQGIRIHVESAGEARPFRMVYALLLALHREHGDTMEWKPFFDTLAGGDGVRKAIQSGTSAVAYLQSIDETLQRFARERPRRYTT
jgi:uncharacterized protein YbbC (DUF1343 family)